MGQFLSVRDSTPVNSYAFSQATFVGMGIWIGVGIFFGAVLGAEEKKEIVEKVERVKSKMK